MNDKVRWRRPNMFVRAYRKMRRKMRARDAAHSYSHPTLIPGSQAQHPPEVGPLAQPPGAHDPARLLAAVGFGGAADLRDGRQGGTRDSVQERIQDGVQDRNQGGIQDSMPDAIQDSMRDGIKAGPPAGQPPEDGGGDGAGGSGQGGRPPGKPGWRRRTLRTLALLLLVLLALAAWFVVEEMRTSELQAMYFSRMAAKVQYRVEAGPTKQIRFPRGSPYDSRLGYASLPDFLGKLKARDFGVARQARMSDSMLELGDMGLFPPYREKTQVGLSISDCRGEPLFSARFPEQLYARFEDAPPLLVKSLLFIENRELLDPRYPNRNPAVEWDRFGKAVFDQALHALGASGKSPGGSTLATQIEKYRHSPEGRTASAKEKLRQMASATLRAYQQGPDTSAARRQIVLDYLNTVPLSAKPGYGEVNGIGDGMAAWYGRGFDETNQALRDGPALEQGSPIQAQIYKEALSLFIAQRRPSYYLGDPDNDLEQLTDSHLRLLEVQGVIPRPLRDAALKAKLHTRLGAPAGAGGSNGTVVPTGAGGSTVAGGPTAAGGAAQAESFVSRKASNAVRTQLAGWLGEPRLYNLDRLDLSVSSTLDARTQKAVTDLLRALRDPEVAKKGGLVGKGLLGNGDPAKVVYSMTLLERGVDANYLRVQTDNYDQPLDINEGAKLDLGSTAKLRTLVTYLDLVGELHQRLHKLDAAQLAAVPVDPKDRISRWALEYLRDAPDRGLPAMLDAALLRPYSANPAEGFMTGGGLHYFGNFKREDNGRVMSVREALRHSVNLVFVRLMRDVAYYYMFQTPGSSATLLQDADDPRRAGYLARFADREGKVFINRFFAKYHGKSSDEIGKILISSVRPTPTRLAAMFRTIEPDAPLPRFSAFVRDNLPSANEVTPERLARLYQQFDPKQMNLADRGYLANLHPLELWLAGHLRRNQGAKLSAVVAASTDERQQVYQWLFKTHRKHAQDKRIANLLEVEGFLEIHRQWKKMGYPFDSLVPSYATALGASADRPAALAEMMGIIINRGLRLPARRMNSLHFAAGTPYETLLDQQPGKPERVLREEVALALAQAIGEVVSDGTAKRLKTAFTRTDGSVVALGGKTGTGDQRFDVYGAGGRLVESRFVNRSATFVFNIGGRLYGSITAYVQGPESAKYDFTSALPVQLLKVLAPTLMPLVETVEGKAGASGTCGAVPVASGSLVVDGAGNKAGNSL